MNQHYMSLSKLKTTKNDLSDGTNLLTNQPYNQWHQAAKNPQEQQVDRRCMQWPTLPSRYALSHYCKSNGHRCL